MSSKQTNLLMSLILVVLPSLLRAETPGQHREAADRHSKAVLERPEDPCPDDGPVAHGVCMTHELKVVEGHLDAFVVALRGALATNPPGLQRRNRIELRALSQADSAWRRYREQVCKLSFDYFTGGQTSIAVPEKDTCRLRLDHAYVRQLSPLVTPHRIE